MWEDVDHSGPGISGLLDVHDTVVGDPVVDRGPVLRAHPQCLSPVAAVRPEGAIEVAGDLGGRHTDPHRMTTSHRPLAPSQTPKDEPGELAGRHGDAEGHRCHQTGTGDESEERDPVPELSHPNRGESTGRCS